MFDETKLNKYILELDSMIEKYSERFALNKGIFEVSTLNKSFLTNERTMSSFANLWILIMLHNDGYKTNLTINEFPIEFKNKISMIEFESLRHSSGLKIRKAQWTKCYVDGYIQVNGIFGNDVTTQLFIEYKMENKFALLNLANDYLKYKTYTANNDSNTAFIYVVFKKEENYPSIISGPEPYFEIINYDISSNPVKGNKRVFIYLPKEQPNKVIDGSLDEALARIDLVSRLSEELLEIIGSNRLKVNKEQMAFVDKMNCFNSKVLKSWTLRNYYSFMKKVWDASNNKKMFVDLESIFDTDISKITDDYIIYEGAKYKDNLAQIYTAEAKSDALLHGISPSSNVSLFIVSICDYFNERFKLGIEPQDYFVKHIRSGKNVRIHEWSKTVDFFKTKLKENYEGYLDGEKKIKKLFYSLMFYITNLFPIIYKIDDGGTINGFSESFSDYKAIEFLQSEINKMIKFFKYKKKIDVEELLYDEKSESANALIEFVNNVFAKY